MAPFGSGKRVHTLSDAPGTTAHRRQEVLSSYASSPEALREKNDNLMKTYHIPALPRSEETLSMLQRIYSEFIPIVRRRGYNVRTLSELCCCGDGLDHDGSGRRKRRKVSDNIWGYNQTTTCGRGNLSHTIHLRLRSPHDHGRMLSYEEVAGTMAHELAHCVHHRHDAKFYKLMDEIQEEHAVLISEGLVSGKQGTNTNRWEQSRGQRLGGGGDGNGTSQGMSNGRKLGGDLQFRQWLKPGEAACVAAEARRLRDEQWCQLCVSPDVSDDKDAADGTHRKRKRGHGPMENASGGGNIVIDLTGECKSQEEPPASARVHQEQHLGKDEWACLHCTYVNSGSLALACSVCGLERTNDGTSAQAVAEMRNEEEAQRSVEQFGFNIYQSIR